jgi:hypothetical protein
MQTDVRTSSSDRDLEQQGQMDNELNDAAARMMLSMKQS